MIFNYKNDMSEVIFELPVREGERPITTPSNPHIQLNQQPVDRKIIDELMNWAFTDLSNISKEPSRISLPGAQAMCLAEDKMCSHCNAFMVETNLPIFTLHLMEVCTWHYRLLMPNTLLKKDGANCTLLPKWVIYLQILLCCMPQEMKKRFELPKKLSIVLINLPGEK